MSIRHCFRPRAVVTYTAALLLSAAGCSPQHAPSSPAAQTALKGSQLAQVRGSLSEQKRLFQAEQQLRSSCMSGRGEVYRPARWHAPAAPALHRDPRHADDVELRRRQGYGPADAVASPPPGRDPNTTHLRSLSESGQERYGHALFGTPEHRISVRLPDGSVAYMNEDGCVAHAEKRLYGDLRTWLKAQMVAVNAETDVLRLITDSERLRRTDAPWRRCMQEFGYTYRTPDKAQAAAAALREEADKGNDGAPSRASEDIAIAVADARCDRRVGRAALARSLDRHYRDQVARSRSDELTTYRTLRSEALASLEPGSAPATG